MPIETKCHVEPQWDRGMKVCSNGPGHMTKMAAMPTYDKNMKNASSLKVCMQHQLLKYHQVCSNDVPGFDLFYDKSNLVPYAFVCEKVKTMDFSETVVVYDIKVGI